MKRIIMFFDGLISKMCSVDFDPDAVDFMMKGKF